MAVFNELQRKIGGPASSLDRGALIAAAEQERQALIPELEHALADARRRLVSASGDETRGDDLFIAANEIRQLAACANRPSAGRLAHLLASYLTHCADRGEMAAAQVTVPLVRAVDQSFAVTEGDPTLKAIVDESARLIQHLGAAGD
ncbi:MAG TPA: hypothetical protein VEA80_05510 [Vitreimonas sp.]|uniref:hypothetical protein n=1 Tax=Vitreimonas sp. TaxID=3069702 RepID=UPI002D4941DE|nr:hypothetical protein [Vitreimonas sp.]HYD86910.1 hypothetical protein [Vitreimonas sp.]